MDWTLVSSMVTHRVAIGDAVAKADLDAKYYASFAATGFQSANACFVDENA